MTASDKSDPKKAQDAGLPRRDEERDRWRESGYRGHAHEDFRPEAVEDGHDDQGPGVGRASPRDYGRERFGAGRDSKPDSRDPPPAAPPGYSGFSQPGGGFSAAPRGGYGEPDPAAPAESGTTAKKAAEGEAPDKPTDAGRKTPDR